MKKRITKLILISLMTLSIIKIGPNVNTNKKASITKPFIVKSVGDDDYWKNR